jgi:hypothetical protein
MMTIILIAAGAGIVAGAALGWKLGRGYERVRPAKKQKKEAKKAR